MKRSNFFENFGIWGGVCWSDQGAQIRAGDVSNMYKSAISFYMVIYFFPIERVHDVVS